MLFRSVPTKFSEEKQQLMKALGATIINTPRELGMQGAIQKAEELKKEIPGAISLQQFSNPNNPLAHYSLTGPEIYNDLKGNIDAVVMGAGSGGTFSGVMRYMKEQDASIQGILADPVGSVIGGGEHLDYNIEGIGNDFIPPTMNMNYIDQVVKVYDKEAWEAARLLARSEGIFAGSSSGAALVAAIQIAKQTEDKNIVVVLPDRGDRYFSSHLYG